MGKKSSNGASSPPPFWSFPIWEFRDSSAALVGGEAGQQGGEVGPQLGPEGGPAGEVAEAAGRLAEDRAKGEPQPEGFVRTRVGTHPPFVSDVFVE